MIHVRGHKRCEEKRENETKNDADNKIQSKQTEKEMRNYIRVFYFAAEWWLSTRGADNNRKRWKTTSSMNQDETNEEHQGKTARNTSKQEKQSPVLEASNGDKAKHELGPEPTLIGVRVHGETPALW